MEACGIEDLLSSFSSDAFAVQSQSEKDLRASLQSFFAVDIHQGMSSHHGQAFAPGSHTTLPTSPWAHLPGTPQDSSGSTNQWLQEIPPPNTPMGTPGRTNGFAMSGSPSMSRSSHFNSPTLGHRTLGELVTVSQSNASVTSVNCMACLHLVQNPSHFSTILPIHHQEGCGYLQSMPSQLQHSIYKSTHNLHLDPTLDQLASIEMDS